MKTGLFQNRNPLSFGDCVYCPHPTKQQIAVLWQFWQHHKLVVSFRLLTFVSNPAYCWVWEQTDLISFISPTQQVILTGWQCCCWAWSFVKLINAIFVFMHYCIALLTTNIKMSIKDINWHFQWLLKDCKVRKPSTNNGEVKIVQCISKYFPQQFPRGSGQTLNSWTLNWILENWENYFLSLMGSTNLTINELQPPTTVTKYFLIVIFSIFISSLVVGR